MHKNLILLFTLLCLIVIKPAYSQTQLDSCIVKLRSPNYAVVLQARQIISTKYQIASIPKLIALMQDTGYAKLFNTADLIYPGAEKDYGHGGMLDYDIDWISVRAAWILEEDNFQDFGFLSKPTIGEKGMTAIKNGRPFERYWKIDVNFADTTSIKRMIKERQILAKAAAQWWQDNKAKWTKLNAIKEALTSHNERREELVLHYFLFSPDYSEIPKEREARLAYYTPVKSLVLKIKKSKSKNKKQAKRLLSEMDDLEKQ